MATKSALRTRLQRRLGFGVVSAIETDRLGEALNAGIARAFSDGVPGLSHETFVGSTLGEYGLTSAAVVALSSTVTTVNDASNLSAGEVRPADILKVVVSGATTKFLIKAVTGATTLSIGVTASAALSGDTNSTVLRRSIRLPSTGQVVSISRLSGSGRASRLVYEPLYALHDPFAEGTPKYFEQRYAAGALESYISLWPAPTDTTEQYLIVQNSFLAEMDDDTDSFPYPEEVLDAILERARLAYMTWSGITVPSDTMLAMEAVRDSSDSLKNSSTSEQIYIKQ